MPVDLVEGIPAGADVPDATGRTVYRMAQEALTNARKHAPGMPVTVVLTGAPGGSFVLEVRNPMPVRVPVGVPARQVDEPLPGAGMGLIGLAERASPRGRRPGARGDSGPGVPGAGPTAVAGMSDIPTWVGPGTPTTPAEAPAEPTGPESPTARVVIVNDDPLVRAGLSMILRGSPTITVVAEADDGEHAQVVVARERPDVVLMDIRMPRRDGISATVGLLAMAHPPKVIVLTTFDTDDLVLAAPAGRCEWLPARTPARKIVEAVHRVIAGEPILSPSVTAQLIASATEGQSTERRDDALAALASLTERERDVAVAIGHGLSNAEIGAQLYMSVATVKSHVTRLFAKLQVENRG